MASKWTDEEIEVLHHYAFSPMREILENLPDRNRKTIYWKLGVLGYNRETYKRYSKEEDKYIEDNYKLLGNRAIAKELKRTEKSICKRMIVTGLKRTDEEISTMRSKNNSCYKKGRKSEKTFDNGTLQLVYDSACDNYFYNIKIDGKFHRFSRYLYENYNDCKLLPDDIIMAIDGNAMNLLKENLVKVTRTELMRSNIDSDDAFIKRIFRVKNYDEVEFIKNELPEIVQLKRDTFKINNQIKQYDRKNKII